MTEGAALWGYAAAAVWGVLIVLGFVGACCVLAEGLWRLTGWLTRREADRG